MKRLNLLIYSILFISTAIYSQSDTSYNFIATQRIQQLLVPGKAPRFTIQFSAFYSNGLMDLAANDNTYFSKLDFVEGANYGTRYGYGFMLAGKYALHKKGNARLIVAGYYNRLQSNFVISKSPEGKVGYNAFSGAIGFENNFTPDRKFKPYIGAEIMATLINGSANLATDSAEFNLNIKNAFRLGFNMTFGFEYAFNNNVGFNLGMKFSHLNVLLKDSKESGDPANVNLNDKFVEPRINYSGWKQFFYSSFYTGFNIYFGMKNKKSN
jgi:opacity protein-like surface antigen